MFKSVATGAHNVKIQGPGRTGRADSVRTDEDDEEPPVILSGPGPDSTQGPDLWGRALWTVSTRNARSAGLEPATS